MHTDTIVSLNGKIVPMTEANVSVFDRSFLYGDSLYEVVRTYEGAPFGLDEHLQRLYQSAALCHMTLSQEPDEYKNAIQKGIQAFRARPKYKDHDVYVRLVVSRGVGTIGFGLKNITTPTQYVIYIDSIEHYPTPPMDVGMSLQISKRVRNHPLALPPAMKSGNYLNNLLAYLTAVEEGYQDALMLDQQGFVTEGTTFNVFYIKRGIVVTPPSDVGILNGITRAFILQTCIENNIPVREVRFKPEQLYLADEVFVSSSLKEVLPVFNIDGKKISKGKPGALSLLLKEKFTERVLEWRSQQVGTS